MKPSRQRLNMTMPATFMPARLYCGEPTEDIRPVKLGPWDVRCPDCGALFFRAERLANGVDVLSLCCGKTERYELDPAAMLRPIQDEAVRELYFGTSEDALHFRQHARAYNTALSVGMPAVQYERRQVRSNHVIAVNGKAVFNAPALPRLDTDGLPRQPGQLYFVDVSEASIGKRILASTDPHLRPHIVQMLVRYLEQHNDLIKTFLLAKEVMQRQDAEESDEDLFAEEDCRVRGLHVLVNPHRDGFRVTDRSVLQPLCLRRSFPLPLDV